MNRIIDNHPFSIREMAKENKDLQRLKGMPELTTEFIDWFRNLSQEQSECVIDAQLPPTLAQWLRKTFDLNDY